MDGRARVEHLVGQPPEILDERELQHARPRPELADGERSDALKAVEEKRELLNIEAAVAVPDQLNGNPVDACVARLLPNRERRQFAIVRARKILADVDDVGCDEVEVVEEPFGGGRYELTVVHILGKRMVRRAQGPGIVGEPRKDAARATAPRVHGEPRGE